MDWARTISFWRSLTALCLPVTPADTELSLSHGSGAAVEPGCGKAITMTPEAAPMGTCPRKQDFCVRSGLMDQHRLFTNEQLAEVYRCVSETLESAYLITPERQKLLEACRNRSDGCTGSAGVGSQSNERELEAMSQEEQLDVTMEM